MILSVMVRRRPFSSSHFGTACRGLTTEVWKSPSECWYSHSRLGHPPEWQRIQLWRELGSGADAMNTVLKSQPAVETRKVFCQNATAAALLEEHTAGWITAALPSPFPAELSSSTVVIGDAPSVFTSALAEAIDSNRARLLYILDSEHTLPLESKGIPVFSFLTLPLQGAVLGSAVQAAFENLRL